MSNVGDISVNTLTDLIYLAANDLAAAASIRDEYRPTWTPQGVQAS